MIFRRRRLAMHRFAVVVVALLTYLVSVAPAAASVVYCISDDGHQGFELVTSSDRNCASCCHDEPAEAGHDGFEAESTGCKDIALSSDLAIRSETSMARDVAAAPVALPVVATSATVPPSGDCLRLPVPPSRNSAASMRRHTVLLI